MKDENKEVLELEDLENEEEGLVLCNLDETTFIKRSPMNFVIVKKKNSVSKEGVEYISYENNGYFTTLYSAIKHYIEYECNIKSRKKELGDLIDKYLKELHKFRDITSSCSQLIQNLEYENMELKDLNRKLKNRQKIKNGVEEVCQEI